MTSKSDYVSLLHDNYFATAGELSTPISVDDTAPSLRAAGVKPMSKDTTRAQA
jgi:hypothetical protein